MSSTVTPPAWFRIVAVLLLLWGLIGVGGFVADRMVGPAQLAAMTDYDRAFYAARPAWSVWAYGIATVTGLAGGAMLLLGRRVALPLYTASLVTAALLFGWALGATDLVAHKGFMGAAAFPIVIVGIGTFAVWLARRAAAHGWIR